MFFKLIRKGISVLFFIIAFPLSVPFILLGYAASKLDRFSDVSVIVSFIPFYLGEHIRYIYYKVLLRKMGNKVVFKFGSFCQYREAEIGSNNLFGYYNIVGLVKIGDDLLSGSHVTYTSGLNQHNFSDPNVKIREQGGLRNKIHLGNDIWIGNNSTICANIGERVVIGTGSIVVKELKGFGVYAGAPAKLIKSIA